MKRAKILIISFLGAIIMFIILTITQKIIVNKEIMTDAFVLKKEVCINTGLIPEMFEKIRIPAAITVLSPIISDYSEIEGKYASRDLHKGQIVLKNDAESAEKLKIINAPTGLEKIAIKINESQNGLAYQIKPKDRIHLYFTGRYGAMKSELYNMGVPGDTNITDNAMYTIKLLNNTEILGIYDIRGKISVSEGFAGVDTIVVAVTAETAELINNFRSQGIFNITA